MVEANEKRKFKNIQNFEKNGFKNIAGHVNNSDFNFY